MVAETSTGPVRSHDGQASGRTATAGAVLRGVLTGQRRSLVLWSIAIAAVSAVYVGFYPAIGDQQMAEMAEMMPEDLAAALGYDQLGDAPGYLAATIFGLLGPALLLVFGIGGGARSIAGQEEDGTLELELTHPVARRTIYLERLAGLWTSLLILVAVLGAMTTLLVVTLDMDASVAGVLAAALGLLLLVGLHATVAFAVGAATGRRAVGLAAAAGLAVVGYIADAIGPMVGVDWLSAISPWAWFLDPGPVAEGVDPVGYSLLFGVAVLAAIVGLVRFDRRDLGV